MFGFTICTVFVDLLQFVLFWVAQQGVLRGVQDVLKSEIFNSIYATTGHHGAAWETMRYHGVPRATQSPAALYLRYASL